MTLDLSSSRSIHIVGIGGSGMSAIAGVLLSMGHTVSGSDASLSPVLERLQSEGATVWAGHDAEKLPPGIDALAISTAIRPDNSEVQRAESLGIPVLRRADLLAAIAGTRRTVAVAGTHGKTTTSTMLALVLEAGGVRPSWVVGGEIVGRDGGAHWDSGAWFVVEADESDGTFLELGAEAVIVTNVEPDHLEHYGGWEGLQSAFENFVGSASGPRVVCIDDEGGRRLADRFDVVSFGEHEAAAYRIVDVQLERYSASFGIEHAGEQVRVRLPAPGLYNVRNATAALAMASELGVPLVVGAGGLESYGGVGRRFTRRGEAGGVTFVDDYAHLPTEVAAALEAARAGKWDRVVAVFQPHRYSRTEQVGRDFANAFGAADVLFLAGIYAAGEQPRPGITGEIVRDAVVRGGDHTAPFYVEDRATLAKTVAVELRPGDLCITLGAGDITRLADEIQALL